MWFSMCWTLKECWLYVTKLHVIGRVSFGEVHQEQSQIVSTAKGFLIAAVSVTP